jgi:transposase-like protein
VRLHPAEKREVFRLVERSELSVCRILAELGIHCSTFYAWDRRCAERRCMSFSVSIVSVIRECLE